MRTIKYLKNIGLCFIASWIVSCSNTDNNKILQSSSIPTTDVKTSDTPYSQSTMFPQDALLLSDSILVVYEPKLEDGFICVYNDKTHDQIAQFGSLGPAPDQFINPRPLFDGILSADKFFVADLKGIYAFDAFNDYSNRVKGDFIEQIPEDFKLYNYLLANNDSVMVCSQTGPHQLSIYNKTTKAVGYRDFFPNNTDIATNDLVKNMNVYEASYTCSENLVAAAYHNWKQIDIYDLSTGEVTNVRFDDYLYNKDMIRYDTNKQIIDIADDAKIYFTQIKSTKNYIYALCWDNIKSVIGKAQVTPTVYQIDWQGNAIAKYKFDRPIANFCIYNDTIKYAIGILEDGEMHILHCDYQQ